MLVGTLPYYYIIPQVDLFCHQLRRRYLCSRSIPSIYLLINEGPPRVVEGGGGGADVVSSTLQCLEETEKNKKRKKKNKIPCELNTTV